MKPMMACFFLVLTVSIGTAQTQSTRPDYEAILRDYNAALEHYDDKCGYRIGNSVWAIAGGFDEATSAVMGELLAFDGGEELAWKEPVSRVEQVKAVDEGGAGCCS